MLEFQLGTLGRLEPASVSIYNASTCVALSLLASSLRFEESPRAFSAAGIHGQLRMSPNVEICFQSPEVSGNGELLERAGTI